MQTVFLAGGFGTRISEETLKIPKPMIKIGPNPILFHIMKHYSKYGFNNFIVLKRRDFSSRLLRHKSIPAA